MHYQPLLDAAGHAVGMEALMRWHHQQRGPISPEAFIPIFEQSGLIAPLSRWALSQASRDAASWNRPLLVAVKLSVIQFEQDNLLELVRAVLEHSHLPASRLELQVTEASLCAGNPKRARTTLAMLRSDGVQVALADFGGAGSAPSQLSDLPLSKIKIARGLVAQISDAEPARSIIRMAIDLAHSRGLCAAADGIETDEQLRFLVDAGCDCLRASCSVAPAP